MGRGGGGESTSREGAVVARDPQRAVSGQRVGGREGHCLPWPVEGRESDSQSRERQSKDHSRVMRE